MEREVVQEMMTLGLFERLLTQIKEDINDNVEPLEELLTFVPFENLVEYLPEEEWDEWYSLYKSVIKNPVDPDDEVQDWDTFGDRKI